MFGRNELRTVAPRLAGVGSVWGLCRLMKQPAVTPALEVLNVDRQNAVNRASEVRDDRRGDVPVGGSRHTSWACPKVTGQGDPHVLREGDDWRRKEDDG